MKWKYNNTKAITTFYLDWSVKAYSPGLYNLSASSSIQLDYDNA